MDVAKARKKRGLRVEGERGDMIVVNEKKKSKKDSEPTEPPHDPGWERVSASSGTFREDKH